LKAKANISRSEKRASKSMMQFVLGFEMIIVINLQPQFFVFENK